jgi:hypothetical protein
MHENSDTKQKMGIENFVLKEQGAGRAKNFVL